MNRYAIKSSTYRLLAILIALFFSGVTMAEPLSGLKKVGEAKLKVLFWDVYNSTLYNQTGEYLEGQFPQALEIDYLRDIDAKDLIERTVDEWKKLDIEQITYERWIPLLSDIFPDIKKGDTLLLRVNDNLHSEFFFNGQTLGRISDSNFGKSFLRIWLDINCSYPKVRNQLIGLKK
jgi:hypothetical protein